MTLPFEIDLNGKVAVVTGAGGILCSMFAEALAKSGAKVALLDLNEEAAKESKGALTAAEIDAALDAYMTSFDYSLENDKLTLKEREYGEEIIFTRVK